MKKLTGITAVVLAGVTALSVIWTAAPVYAAEAGFEEKAVRASDKTDTATDSAIDATTDSAIEADATTASAVEVTTGSAIDATTDSAIDATTDSAIDVDPDEPTYEVIFRMYNPYTGEHLYTTDANERAMTYLWGWDDEDIGWVAPKESETPIYRLFNGVEHFYTMDAHEAEVLPEYGWLFEGASFYSDDTYQAKRMYRLYCPWLEVGAHHYTTDWNERKVLLNNGWVDEGIAWYALNSKGMDIELPPLPERYEHNITNTDSFATLEADVMLGGVGTGTHAKMLFQTPYSAVSFGIQHDIAARYPYTGQTYYICENVASNDPGGQRYTFYDLTSLNTWQHIMLTYSIGGIVRFFVNGQLVSEVYNEYLDYDDLYFGLEGSGRKEGDYIDVSFRKIRAKTNGVYDPNRPWTTGNILTNSGLKIDKTGFDEKSPATGTARIYGTIEGIGDMDWDSAYSTVSGVFRIGGALREV